MAKKNSEIYNIVVLSFDGQKKADTAISKIHKSGVLKGYKILVQATVSRDAKGKTHFKELGRGGLGAGIGAVAGGTLALVGGPVGLLAMVVGGSLVGGVAGKYLGRPIKKGDLEKLAATLSPDTSAFILLVEDKDSEKVVDSLTDYKAKVVTLTVGDELSGELSIMTTGEIEKKPKKVANKTKESKPVKKTAPKTQKKAKAKSKKK